jgi:hypothetical protein
MTNKTLMLAALLAAGATTALAQQPSHPPSEGPCLGRVVVETVRPKTTVPGGFTYEVLLQNQTQERMGYRVTVVFEGFQALAQQTGATIRIPNNQITIVVPPGFGSRSAETQFGTVSLNTQRVYYGAGVGARYDSGAITNGSPAAVRLANCAPFRG